MFPKVIDLLSIADDQSLTSAHVAPVQQMLELLHANFDPTTPERGSSLAIQAGRAGARPSTQLGGTL